MSTKTPNDICYSWNDNCDWNFIANLKSYTMLRWALIFFIIAIVAAVFGFGGIAAGAVSIARILFFIFIVLFLISLISGLLRK